MVLLLCIQNSLVPGSDGQKGTLIGEKIASGATTPRSSSPIPTLERRVRLEEEVWATLTSNSRKGYSTEVPNAARHQPASVHNKPTTHTDSTHTTHTQIAHGQWSFLPRTSLQELLRGRVKKEQRLRYLPVADLGLDVQPLCIVLELNHMSIQNTFNCKAITSPMNDDSGTF